MRRLLATFVAVGVVAGAVFAFRAVSGSVGGPPATAARAASAAQAASVGIPGGPSAAVSPATAADAVCAVRPEQISQLTRISAKSPRIENLRDGLPLLRERMAQLRVAADGRPSLAPLEGRLERIYAQWSRALKLHDAGHPRRAATALSAADVEITKSTRELDQAYPAHARSCT